MLRTPPAWRDCLWKPGSTWFRNQLQELARACCMSEQSFFLSNICWFLLKRGNKQVRSMAFASMVFVFSLQFVLPFGLSKPQICLLLPYSVLQPILYPSFSASVKGFAPLHRNKALTLGLLLRFSSAFDNVLRLRHLLC